MDYERAMGGFNSVKCIVYKHHVSPFSYLMVTALAGELLLSAYANVVTYLVWRGRKMRAPSHNG
jgi:hypothetical protein